MANLLFQEVSPLRVGRSILADYRFQRPANATQYTAGDVISDNATNSTIPVFVAARFPGGGGIVHSVALIDSADEATNLSADLFLFNRFPNTVAADNAAYAPTDTDLESAIGAISLDGTSAGNFKAGNANAIIQTTSVGLVFQCSSDSQLLYGVLVARNAYTPISIEVFKIRLGILQD